MENKNLYEILEYLKQRFAILSKQSGDKSSKEKEKLIKNIEFVQKCIKIAIIRKVDSMSDDELQIIALHSLSVISSGINPEEYIAEYDRLSKYVSAYENDLLRRRDAVANLTFIVEGPLDLLVDEDGNLKHGFILADDSDAKLLKTQAAKFLHKMGKRSIKVRIPKHFLSDDNLEVFCPSYDNFNYGIKYIFRPNESSNENLQGSITLGATPETQRELATKYSSFEAKKARENMKRMEVILPEMIVKKRLLTDKDYLKKYVKELLVDPEFIKLFISSLGKTDEDSKEMRELYKHDITVVSTEELFTNSKESIGLASVENLRKMFDSPDKIDMYMTALTNKKGAIIREFPGIWLKPENPTDEINGIINSASGIFREKFPVGCHVYPEFITEEDLQLLEQNKAIIKNVNGVDISFKLALSSYRETSGYTNKASQQSPNFTKRLKEVIDGYRRAITSDYPKQLERIAEYDRKLEALEQLKSEYGQPGMSGPASPSRPSR